MFSTKFWFLDPIPREGQMPVLPPPLQTPMGSTLSFDGTGRRSIVAATSIPFTVQKLVAS